LTETALSDSLRARRHHDDDRFAQSG